MSKRTVKQFERLSREAADIGELVNAYRRALYRIGFQRLVRAPKDRWEMAQWLFHHFEASFRRLRRKAKKKAAKSSKLAVNLADRELEILRRTGTGRSRREIADEIGLSYHTVDFYVRKILRKLDATNMLVAVTKAHHLGLLPFELPKTDPKRVAKRERAERARQARTRLMLRRRALGRKRAASRKSSNRT